MTGEVTLSIIKPDAVHKNYIGEIISRFEKDGLRVAALKMLVFSRQQFLGIYGDTRASPTMKTSRPSWPRVRRW
jgi:nucleoside-diphosphate kinase